MFKKFFSSGLGLLIISLQVFAAGPVLAAPTGEAAKTPSQIIDSVVKVYLDKGTDDERFGTGFILDSTGCFITNGHVALDPDTGDPVKDIQVAVTRDFKLAPEVTGKAHVVYSDQSSDYAILCLDTPEFFPALSLASDQAVDALTFTDDVKVVGYPLVGSDSVTYALGKIIGFWANPDLKQISGADKVDPNHFTLIKLDAVSGPGGSGSPILNKDNDVIGMMFAGQIYSASPSLAIWEKTFANWRNLAFPVHQPTPGCLFDPLYGSYVRGDGQYYDDQCLIVRDSGLDAQMSSMYQTQCGVKIDDDVLQRSAAHLVKYGGTIDRWSQYLNEICPPADAPPANLGTKFAPTNPPAATPGNDSGDGQTTKSRPKTVKTKTKVSRSAKPKSTLTKSKSSCTLTNSVIVCH